jgi:hypothetical protein
LNIWLPEIIHRTRHFLARVFKWFSFRMVSV